MKSLFVGGALVAAFMLAPAAEAQSLYTCGEGTVRQIEIIPGHENVPVVIELSDADADEGSMVTEIVIEKKPDAYVVTVQLRDVVYTGRSSADVPWNLDPRTLTKDQTIQVCANSREMVLDRLDGTDYRGAIVSTSVEIAPAAGRR